MQCRDMGGMMPSHLAARSGNSGCLRELFALGYGESLEAGDMYFRSETSRCTMRTLLAARGWLNDHFAKYLPSSSLPLSITLYLSLSLYLSITLSISLSINISFSFLSIENLISMIRSFTDTDSYSPLLPFSHRSPSTSRRGDGEAWGSADNLRFGRQRQPLVW